MVPAGQQPQQQCQHRLNTSQLHATLPPLPDHHKHSLSHIFNKKSRHAECAEPPVGGEPPHRMHALLVTTVATDLGKLPDMSVTMLLQEIAHPQPLSYQTHLTRMLQEIELAA
jgi:hypothetical protein